MSLWQGTRWQHRQNQPGPAVQQSRPSLSGNSSAGASTSSLLSTSSGGGPRRPLNPLNLRQERRSNSIPRAKAADAVKSDHDPVKILIGILGEAPGSTVEVESSAETDVETTKIKRKVDAGGKTFGEWLEELELDKSTKLSKAIEERRSLNHHLT